MGTLELKQKMRLCGLEIRALWHSGSRARLSVGHRRTVVAFGLYHPRSSPQRCNDCAVPMDGFNELAAQADASAAQQREDMRRQTFKPAIDASDSRRKREEVQIKIRKQKKKERLAKRRMVRTVMLDSGEVVVEDG